MSAYETYLCNDKIVKIIAVAAIFGRQGTNVIQ